MSRAVKTFKFWSGGEIKEFWFMDMLLGSHPNPKVDHNAFEFIVDCTWPFNI